MSHDSGPTESASSQLDEVEAAFNEYEESDRMPVLDSDGLLVGFMSFSDYYAGPHDPDLIEVYSYESEELVGYRARFIGFVPLAAIGETVDPRQRIDELYGEAIRDAEARHAELNEGLNGLSREQLEEYLAFREES